MDRFEELDRMIDGLLDPALKKTVRDGFDALKTYASQPSALDRVLNRHTAEQAAKLASDGTSAAGRAASSATEGLSRLGSHINPRSLTGVIAGIALVGGLTYAATRKKHAAPRAWTERVEADRANAVSPRNL